MNFGQAIASGFGRYVEFNGRSSRSEYWYWVLFVVMADIVLGMARPHGFYGWHSGNGLQDLFGLATLLPSIAVAVRRLHDTDRSGWWYLIVFTIIGIIPLIIWYCTPGSIGDNRYGSNPLANPAPLAG